MKTLPQGEKAPSKVYDATDFADSETAMVTACIKPDAKSPVRHSFEGILVRFADVSIDEVVSLATRTIWINGLQRPYRDATDAERVSMGKAWESNGFDVRAWLDRERKAGQALTPADRVGRMSDEEKEVYRKLLGI